MHIYFIRSCFCYNRQLIVKWGDFWTQNYDLGGGMLKIETKLYYLFCLLVHLIRLVDARKIYHKKIGQLGFFKSFLRTRQYNSVKNYKRERQVRQIVFENRNSLFRRFVLQIAQYTTTSGGEYKFYDGFKQRKISPSPKEQMPQNPT